MGARGPLNEGMRTKSGPSSYRHHPPTAVRPAGRKTRIGDFSGFYRDSASFSSTQIPKGTEGCDLRGAENRGRSTCYASYVDEVLAYVVGVGGAANTKYVHSNHLYSAAALTDNTGAVFERFRYDAYGRRTVTDAAGVSRQASSYGFQRGFTGYHKDAETGLYYARARMYSAGLGRFVSREPLSYHDGMNLYSGYFVPNRLDPSGLFVVPPVVAVAPVVAPVVAAAATVVTAAGVTVVAAGAAVTAAGLAVGYGIGSGIVAIIESTDDDGSQPTPAEELAKRELAYQKKKYGDCTQAQWKALDNAKKDACKNPANPISCNEPPPLTCEELKTRAKNGRNCYDARKKLTNICFPGSTTHDTVDQTYKRAVEKCEEKIKDRCCP